MNFTPKNQVVPNASAYISTNEFFNDPDDESRVIVAHHMQFDGLADAVKALSNEGIHGSKEMKLVMMIPPGLAEHACQVWGITWQEFWSDKKWIKRLINDPDFAHFRVAPGRY